MDNNLYLLRRGARVPVHPEIFKHGGGIYLAFVGEGVHIPLLASAATLLDVLRQALGQVETAIAANDQGHVSRAPDPPRQPVLADLNGDPRHDFPVFVRRFARSSPDVVAAVAQLYRSQGYKVPGMDGILQAFDDLDGVISIRRRLVNDQGELVYGARTRIAKTLGIRDAGNYRQRIDNLIWLLKSEIMAGLEDSGGLLEVSGASLEVSGPESGVSNGPGGWKKAAGE
jgi:hypothetical protein